MKLYLHLLLPAVLTLSCTEGSKFKGAAASATVEKTYEEPSEDAAPSEEVPDVEPSPVSEPAIAALKLGINFEDQVPGDRDFDDAVLCFEGAFAFTKSSRKIIASKDQEIVASAYRNGDCVHTITAEIVDKNEKIVSTQTYTTDKATSVKFDFKKGDRLEVYMQPVTQSCDPTLKRDMHNIDYAEIDVDLCRKPGEKKKIDY